jgi:hypothetical protein
MISTTQAHQYLHKNGVQKTPEEVKVLLDRIDQAATLDQQKTRITYEIWDKVSDINGVPAETILARDDFPQGGEAYLLYLDGVLRYLQPHDPTQSGYVAMDLTLANTRAAEHKDNLAVEITDSIVLNEVMEQSIEYTPQTLDEHKAYHIEQLDNECEKAILAGFTSATTGHHYRTNRDDQINFIGRKDEVQNDPNITEVTWKTENLGPITHTRDEFLAVYMEGIKHKDAMIGKFWQLKAQVNAATTETEVYAVVW